MRSIIVYLLILAAALLWSPVAVAQSGEACRGTDNCDEGQAMMACQAKLGRLEAEQPQLKPFSNKQCKRSSNSTNAQGLIQASATYGQHNVNGLFGEYAYKASCASRAPEILRVNLSKGARALPKECLRGCQWETQPTPTECTTLESGPNIGYNCWYDGAYNGATCNENDDDDPGDDEPPKKCEPGQVRLPSGKCGDQGDCPVGQHKLNGKCEPVGQCPTGKIKAPDGSCVDEGCPAGQAKGEDGTCKPDDDGDGDPNDGEDTGKFSGGESCEEPPQCSGDNILCGQARIQWRIDCNTRRADSVHAGNGCSMADVPICVGKNCDPLEYAQLLQAWRGRCAVERLGTGVPIDPAPGQIRDYLTGSGQSLPPVSSPWLDEDYSPATWSSGLGQGTCPAPVSTTVSIGQSSAQVEFSFQPICDFAAALRTLLLACSAILSVLIISGARK
ncbi:virulence factor TspB C-terminal domain-related protein [Lysobacter enzymogenes]|uniref:virulence factor TspB C-terminal domain-related protein n=1 Tax=Lysobacter enzymogenes TaxID=69 RepID=UPI001AF21F8B|nr:virulence factor TspB C-terminal domain-related protein [Lysobacter enzymogenes]QQQ03668.1 hypothetical protein JHW41_12330 [Lysobacter enzymogenes]